MCFTKKQGKSYLVLFGMIFTIFLGVFFLRTSNVDASSIETNNDSRNLTVQAVYITRVESATGWETIQRGQVFPTLNHNHGLSPIEVTVRVESQTAPLPIIFGQHPAGVSLRSSLSLGMINGVHHHQFVYQINPTTAGGTFLARSNNIEAVIHL